MSGFEVIGLVLGLYPIVVDAYRKSKGEGIEKAIRRLETEHLLFDDFVSRLLGPDLQLEEGQLLRLKTSKDPAFWKENDLQAKLEHRYNFVRTRNIISLISDLNKLLQDIGKELPGAARSFVRSISTITSVGGSANIALWNRRNSNPNFDLHFGTSKPIFQRKPSTASKDSQDPYSGQFSELRMARCTCCYYLVTHEALSRRQFLNELLLIPRSSRFAQLKTCRETLRDLLSEHTTPSSIGSFRQPLPPIDFPRRDNSDAKHIYSAICNGYNCDCSLPHYANIEVPQLSTAPKLVWPRGRKEETRLHILFPIEDTSAAGITDALANVSLQHTHYVEPPPPYLKSVSPVSLSGVFCCHKA